MSRWTERLGFFESIRRFRCAALAALVLLGCNVGGYPDLGSELDNLAFTGSKNATAWMRTLADGSSELLVLGAAPEGRTAGFVLVTMRTDSTGTILAGEYTHRAATLVLSATSEYTKTAEFDRPPSGRTGSTRTDFETPEEMRFTLEETDGRLRLDGDDGTAVMIDLWEVVSAIDPSTQAGMEMIARVYNLSTVSLQMRIPGFGGAGLLQYLNEPGEFVGVLGGRATIEMSSPTEPRAEILFFDYKDFPGMVLDGDQISKTDMSGEGTLTGTVRFSMNDPREGGTFHVAGDLTYRLGLTNGRSSSGGYTVIMDDGADWEIAYDTAETLDFRSLLPPE